MKKTYIKLNSELLLIENEQGFMSCSTHIRPLEVQEYIEYNDSNFGFDSGSFDISFDD